jgi:hypothetical protein
MQRYEIFQKFPSKHPTWVESATDLRNARKRLKELVQMLCGQPLFQVVIFPLAVGHAKPPAIVVHDDVNVVGVVEGRCCAVERSIVEIPLWRSLVPDEFIELVEVFRIAGLADWSRK